MKRIAIVLSWMFVVFVALPVAPAGATIKYGYPTPVDGIWPSGSPGFLLGFAITVPQQMELTHVGILTRNLAGNVKVGVYSDSGGNPNTKLAQTGATNLPVHSDTMIPVTSPTTLSAGTYWFMATYDGIGTALRSPGNFNVSMKYVSFDYNNTLPATFPAHSTFSQIPMCYYLAEIPEPTTLTLLGLAGLALLTHRRW
jgi:hypothetical protein